MGMDYWVDRNFNDVEDRSILDLPSASGRQALKTDPVLGDLHRKAVVWRQDRFRTLMADEDWRSLYGRLLLTPPSRALGRSEAEAIWALQQRASVVLG